MSLVLTPDTLAAEMEWRYGDTRGAARYAPARPSREIAATVRARLRAALSRPAGPGAVPEASATRTSPTAARPIRAAVASS
jgi:hypothetical protein